VTDPAASRPTIDDLLDRAIRAINSGDRAAADELASRVLAVDQANVEAEELLAAPADHGELRRLTLLFADMVDSTQLSTLIEPETYRLVIGRYRDEVLRIVNQYEGHIGETKGDGLLALFGHPQPHENDVRRAVQAGLDITHQVERLSEHIRRRFGFDISVRVGIHRGLVYLDTDHDDVYGFAVNLASRMCSIAEPGNVLVSAAVEQLVRDRFELERQPPQRVKGVDGSIVPYRAIAEREPSPASLGTLIGRQREIAYIEAGWQQAGGGSVVALCGEPGIGKSRVVRAAMDLADRSDGVVVELFGSPFHTEVGLHPVRKLLERRCGITRTSDVEERLRLLDTELRELSLDPDVFVPLLAPVLGISPGAGYVPAAADGHRLREKIIGGVHDYVLACIRGRRGLLVAEDMHWFDPSTTEVVRSLVDAEIPQLMVVMTARKVAALPEDSPAKVFELGPLSGAESNELIAALHPPMSDSERVAVGRRCGGVPLYIEEVVAKLKEQPTDAAESAQVPDTLYQTLLARLRSSESAVRVVEAAATIGTQFDRGLLGQVAEMNDQDLDAVLEELRKAAVLEPVDNGVWRYRHELLREVAAELPPPTVRRNLHGRVADALESASSQGDPDWPLIADHYEQAHRVDDAVAAYQQASAAARHRGALEEARRYLSRALTQLDKLPQGRERDRRETHVRLRRGFLASAIEGPSSAETAADFERCLHLGGTESFSDEMFATLMALFTYYVTRGDLRRGQQIVESLRIGVEDGREWWKVENIGGAGVVSFLRGEFSDASGQLEEAQMLMSSRGERDVEAEWFMPYDPIVLVFANVAHGRWVLGNLAGAEAALALGEERAAKLAFPQGPYSSCYVKWIRSWVNIEAGLAYRAAEVCTDMVQLAQNHGFDQWIATGATLYAGAAAEVAIADGRVDSVEVSNGVAALIGWATTSRLVGASGWVTWFDGRGARLLIATGRLAEARDQLNLGLQLAEDTGMRFYDAELLRLRAATHDDPDDRHEDIASAFELGRSQGSPVFALRAALDDYQLHGETARQSVDEAMAMFPADSTWPELARARALLGEPQSKL
jgi:class 3 adenylate cyclase/tetratricopeptide (TPR) repeat protein